MLRALSLLSLVAGLTLACAAVVLFANSQFCWFNRESCGMSEPIVAAYALTVALSLMVAGLLLSKRKTLAAGFAGLPAVLALAAVVGQALGWW